MANEIPRFRVEQAPGFFDNQQLHAVGTELDWIVPDDWNEGRNGPHPMSLGPSSTFTPLNDAAKALQAKHKARLGSIATPVSEAEELKKRLAKTEELLLSLSMELSQMRSEASKKK